MARGLNKVMIMGNLGADPEMRYMPSGDAVANLRVATSEVWKDRQTGERQERTEWHRVVLYKRLAEIAGQYLHKGSKVFIEGSLRTSKWQDQNGQDRYSTDVVASNMQLMDSKGEGSAPMDADSHEQGMSSSRPAAAKPVPATTSIEEAFDDDIPF